MIPEPNEITCQQDYFPIYQNTPLFLHVNNQNLLPAAHFFVKTISTIIPWINIQNIINQNDSPTQLINLVHLDESSIHPESYNLKIAANNIEITAGDDSGILYGIVTLIQMFAEAEQAEGFLRLKCCSINDKPALEWRGMHLDVSRHFFPVPVIERFLEILALHKINIFHWHLTDDQGWRIQIDCNPKLTEVGAYRVEDNGKVYGGFYSKDDIRFIVKRAGELGITVVPEIEMPGHSSAVLAAYPELSCYGKKVEIPNTWGIFKDVLCPSKPATYHFLENVLEEVCDLFPGKWVHIGGDECPSDQWKNCPNCRELVKKEKLNGVDYLQGWLNNWIAENLQSQDKVLVGWDEILDRGAPKGAVVMAWRGFDQGINAIENGHKVVMSPTQHCYFDYAQAKRGEPKAFQATLTLEDVLAFDPIPLHLNLTQRQQVLGGQGNLWTERIDNESHLQYMLLPRLCALAETLWTGKSVKDTKDFHHRLLKHLVLLKSLGINYRPVSGEV
ncbi:beta-N-acetylhexosaminidase [bacterium]|nr:beta-N-acetylhexosaminidase [bacterium]